MYTTVPRKPTQALAIFVIYDPTRANPWMELTDTARTR